MKPILVLLVLLLPAAALAAAGEVGPCPFAAYWCDSWRGWHFYEAPEPLPEPKPAATPHRPAPAVPAPAQSKPPELEAFRALRQRLEDTRQIAIMQPTEANVRHYLELENAVYARSSRFSEVAQRIVWATPELDGTLTGRPANAAALDVWERNLSSSRATNIAELARDRVILFFFRGDCPYCHAYAPILRRFQERFGIVVIPVSIDGGTLPEYPAPRANNGIASTLNVTQVPATFLAAPRTGQIAPIGFGVLSESELIERIDTVSSPFSQALVPSTTRQIRSLP